MRKVLLMCAGLAMLPGVVFAQANAASSQAKIDAAKDRNQLEIERLKDPEYRRARVADARSAIARDNPGFAQDLQLSERELGQLLDLLAEHQIIRQIEGGTLVIGETIANLRGLDPTFGMRTSAPTRAGAVDPSAAEALANNQAAINEYSRKQRELDRRREQAVASLLGPARSILWQQYQENKSKVQLAEMAQSLAAFTSARLELDQIQAILVQARQPIADTQKNSLLNALVAGMQRQAAEAALPVGEAAARDMAMIQEEARQRREKNHRRTLGDIAPLLSAQQVTTLRTEFDRQDALGR